MLLEPSTTPVRNGHGPRCVRLPPPQHLVSSVPRLRWARAHGWVAELTCAVAASGGCVAVVESRSRAASGFPGCARRRPGPHSPSLTCLLGRAPAALAALLPRSRRRAAGVARYPPLRLEQRMPWRAANPRRALGDARWVTRWFTDVPLEQARWEQRRTWRAPRARRCCT